MAGEHNEQILKAKELFDKGMNLVDIAKELDRPQGTIRRWKHDYGWGGERSDKKANVRKEKKRVVTEAVEQVLLNDELNDKQQIFCVLYAMGDNATAAYQKAYECSYQTAMVNGSRLLRNAKVKEEVKRLKKERFETQLFGEHDIFQWYLDVATSSITDFVKFGREEVEAMGAFGPIKDKETGKSVMKEVNYVKFKESLQVNGHVIKKVKMGKDGASIELYDAMKAMDWLADHMYMGTTEQQGFANCVISAYEKRSDTVKKESEVDAE